MNARLLVAMRLPRSTYYKVAVMGKWRLTTIPGPYLGQHGPVRGSRVRMSLLTPKSSVTKLKIELSSIQ